MKPKIGDTVKFKDDLWEEKKELGMNGWLFGFNMSSDHPNKFTITKVNNQGDPETGEDDFELELDGYPWLVYFDEMKIINDQSISS